MRSCDYTVNKLNITWVRRIVSFCLGGKAECNIFQKVASSHQRFMLGTVETLCVCVCVYVAVHMCAHIHLPACVCGAQLARRELCNCRVIAAEPDG